MALASPPEHTEGVGSDPEVLANDAVRLVRRRREPADASAAEEPGPAQPLPLWLKLAAAVLVLATAVGWYADHQVAARETTALAACDRALETASHVYDARMGATYNYLRPSLTGSPSQQAKLLGLMALPARQALPDARASLDRCGGLHVLAWHATHLEQRNAATAYAAALVLRLRLIASHRQEFNLDDRRLAELRRAADISPALESM
jgi:hypothetical protein